MATTANAGRDSGKMMRVKICSAFAPSMRAASTRTLGIESKKLLITMMINAWAASGSQTDHQLSVREMPKIGRWTTLHTWGMSYATEGPIGWMREKQSG